MAVRTGVCWCERGTSDSSVAYERANVHVPSQSGYPVRKTDPNRFKSLIQMPEGAAQDPDYLRAIQDVRAC